VELNERMSIVPEFERESNEHFTEHYRAFILEWDNSYYMVASFALFVLLLAVVSQMDRLGIAAIMEGEEYVEEMLDIFIEDTTKELSEMRDASSMRNYVKLENIIHETAPLWEMIHINISRCELKGTIAMPSEKWSGISDERIEKLIEAVEQAVEKVKK
jgi:ATPase/histidine kinase/DNA gyrase B/HSP90 domain protein